MKVVKLEAFPVRVAYKHVEASSLINRGGITDVIVKITADNGLVGWGECTRAADTAGIESAVRNMAPLVIGREPLGQGAIHRDLAIYAVWAFQPMTGNFAYAGIDMALWDLCGKEAASRSTACSAAPCAKRSTTSTTWSGARPEEIERQARDGVKQRLPRLLHQGRRRRAQGREMLEALRGVIGRTADPHRRQSGLDHAPGGEAAHPLARALRSRLRRSAGADRPGREHDRSARARRVCRSASTRACGARPTPIASSRAAAATISATASTGSARSAAGTASTT